MKWGGKEDTVTGQFMQVRSIDMYNVYTWLSVIQNTKSAMKVHCTSKYIYERDTLRCLKKNA